MIPWIEILRILLCVISSCVKEAYDLLVFFSRSRHYELHT